MSLDVMKQALSAAEFADAYIREIVTGSTNREVAQQLLLQVIADLRAAIEQAQEPWVRTIKTWQQRCEEHPDHDGIVSEHMIQARMQEEIDELRAAIDQAQEPVAWVGPSWLNPETRTWGSKSFEPEPIKGWIPLYTATRQWQGLTDEEIKAPVQKALRHFGFDPTQYSLGGAATIGFYGLAKEIEAKLREKNT